MMTTAYKTHKDDVVKTTVIEINKKLEKIATKAT